MQEAPPLTITPTPNGFRASGEIDASTVDELISVLRPLPGASDVELDMSGVEFIDSSGLRVLIQAHQSAEAQNRRLVVVQPSAIVSRLLEVSGLKDLFHIVVPTENQT